MSTWARFTIGMFSLFFAWIFIISREGSKNPAILWVLAGLCVIVALACFSRTVRTPALRIIGGAVFLFYLCYLAFELRSGILKHYEGSGSPHWLNALKGFFVFGLPGLYLALRGVYPAWGRWGHVFRGESGKTEGDSDHRP
jgi:hypothetical protein